MAKKQSAARQQRRLYEKFLKKFHPIQFAEYKSGVMERGAKIHQDNVNAVSKAEEAYYEEIQNRMIQNMRSEGKTNEEIDTYIEDWVKTIKVWGSNSRPMRRREINREKLQVTNG
jgi:DNA phosphorothioation-dependent restriction protein DptG